jgi:hypothetical protein
MTIQSPKYDATQKMERTNKKMGTCSSFSFRVLVWGPENRGSMLGKFRNHRI